MVYLWQPLLGLDSTKRPNAKVGRRDEGVRFGLLSGSSPVHTSLTLIGLSQSIETILRVLKEPVCALFFAVEVLRFSF